MAEYAIYAGESVQIGVCENLHYLRAEQARNVAPMRGSVDPVADRDEVRFRFPWPDEDGTAPGRYRGAVRRMPLWALKPPQERADHHYGVQFTADGYNVVLPCPEATDEPAHGLKVARNGFNGAVFLAQQAVRNDLLVPILRCRCGMAWSVTTLEGCAPLFDTLAREGGRATGWTTGMCAEITARVRQGFDPEYVAALFGHR